MQDLRKDEPPHGERFTLLGNPGLYFISYPRSGRTWLRLMIGKALCLHYNIDEKVMLWTERVTAAAGINVAQFFHDDADFIEPVAWEALIPDKSYYRNKQVIFLTRAIDDLMVSSYFHATKRISAFSGSISEFLRDPTMGVRKVVAFYEIWHRCRHQPRTFLALTYEELHASPAISLRAVLNFMGASAVSDASIAAAVQFASFSNMRALEESDHFAHKIMRPADPADTESYKVRRGVVGGASTYLSDSDLCYINEMLSASSCPFLRMSSRPSAPAG